MWKMWENICRLQGTGEPQEESYDMELPQLWKGYPTQFLKHALKKVQEFKREDKNEGPQQFGPLAWFHIIDNKGKHI